MITPLSVKLEGDAERVRRSHHEAIVEQQGLVASATQVVNDVSLVDSAVTLVPHGLGRAPRVVLVSPPRNAVSAGLLVELTDPASNPDRTKYAALRASGFGATVTVDVEVK